MSSAMAAVSHCQGMSAPSAPHERVSATGSATGSFEWKRSTHGTSGSAALAASISARLKEQIERSTRTGEAAMARAMSAPTPSALASMTAPNPERAASHAMSSSNDGMRVPAKRGSNQEPASRASSCASVSCEARPVPSLVRSTRGS